MVIHLESVAKKRPDLYGYGTNSARTSTVEQAQKFNDGVYKAWQKHPNFNAIPFEESFDDKVAKAVSIIDRTLGKRKELNPTVAGV